MITSKTRMVGLFGHPVQHSLSPHMHNAAFTAMKLEYAYAAFDVLPEQLPAAVEGIRALQFRGVNVTIPHKVAVMSCLDEIDPLAARIGAVNTIVNENGRLIGYNTDGLGYVRSLVEETGLDLTRQRVTLIGAGGAARAVAFTLAEHGVQRIRIVNRSREKAVELAESLRPYTEADAVEQGTMAEAVAEATLLINTTSIGMYPHWDQMPVEADWLRPHQIVSDLIYNPLTTKLLEQAAARGAATHSGVGMFINQGALAYELWTQTTAPADLMREVVLRHLQQGGN